MLKDYGHRFTRRASILDIYVYISILFLFLSRGIAIRRCTQKSGNNLFPPRNLLADYRTIFFLFLRVARLRSRVTNKYNRGESLVKKARRKNLHYYPRERFR